MSKYLLKQEHTESTIITKSPDGHDVVVTKNTFNDYFAECMLRSGQGHLVMINTNFKEEPGEKKSFTPIGDGVILLTSTPDQIGKNEPKETVKEPELKLPDGQPQQKRAYKKRNT